MVSVCLRDRMPIREGNQIKWVIEILGDLFLALFGDHFVLYAKWIAPMYDTMYSAPHVNCHFLRIKDKIYKIVSKKKTRTAFQR